MKSLVLIASLWLLAISPARAQVADFLLDIDRGRTEGLFSKSPVFQRAILSLPPKSSGTALLWFRGQPGIARIESIKDKNRNLNLLGQQQRLIYAAGIAIVIVDCPTDQWGHPGPVQTSCDDVYRESQMHADDVRSVIAELKAKHGLTRFFIMGHSMGSISSRWLAKNLGNEIAGSIHSASITISESRWGRSGARFSVSDIRAPALHLHHEQDACLNTPYDRVKAYAGDMLVTIRGGTPSGNPCAIHYHGYQGREEAAVAAVVTWITTGKVVPVVGE